MSRATKRRSSLRCSGVETTHASTPAVPWPHDEFVHAWWVEPGVVLAGEYPGDRDPARAIAKLDLLVDHGVRTFVDLTARDQLAPYEPYLQQIAARRDLDIRRVAHPIPDMGVIATDDYDAIVDTVEESSTRGAVYVHCWGGIGRTSTVVGCLLVHRGLDADAALATITRLRAGTRKAHLAAPQAATQIEVIRARARARARTWAVEPSADERG